jgi:hypothetical protein
MSWHFLQYCNIAIHNFIRVQILLMPQVQALLIPSLRPHGGKWNHEKHHQHMRAHTHSFPYATPAFHHRINVLIRWSARHNQSMPGVTTQILSQTTMRTHTCLHTHSFKYAYELNNDGTFQRRVATKTLWRKGLGFFQVSHFLSTRSRTGEWILICCSRVRVTNKRLMGMHVWVFRRKQK